MLEMVGTLQTAGLFVIFCVRDECRECLLWTCGVMNRFFKEKNAAIFSFIHKDTPTCPHCKPPASEKDEKNQSSSLELHHFISSHHSSLYLSVLLSLSGHECPQVIRVRLQQLVIGLISVSRSTNTPSG